MKNKIINIACLGAGKHALKNTIPAIKSLGNFKLVAIYKRNIKKDLKFFNELECLILDDLDKIFKIKDLNAVYISSPPSLHYSMAKKALFHNKHVIIEKPSTTTLIQAKNLCTTARKKKLILMEGLMYKYHDQFIKLLKYTKKT